MLFSDLVAVSRRVSESAGRLDKVERLVAALRSLEPGEIPAGVGLLSGEPRQGRIGVGWAALEAARAPEPPTLFDAASEALDPPLTVAEVDAALERLAALGGAGSGSRRAAALAALFRRAEAEGGDFLVRLFTGELRQGALAGTMEEAIARASGLDRAEVR